MSGTVLNPCYGSIHLILRITLRDILIVPFARWGKWVTELVSGTWNQVTWLEYTSYLLYILCIFIYRVCTIMFLFTKCVIDNKWIFEIFLCHMDFNSDTTYTWCRVCIRVGGIQRKIWVKASGGFKMIFPFGPAILLAFEGNSQMNARSLNIKTFVIMLFKITKL